MRYGGRRRHYDRLEKARQGLDHGLVLAKPEQSLRAHSMIPQSQTQGDINKAYLLKEEMSDHIIATDGLARLERGK